MNGAGAMVTQEMIDGIERGGEILIPFAIDDIQTFAGVQVEEFQAILGT